VDSLSPPELSPEALAVLLDAIGEGVATSRRGRIGFANRTLLNLAGRSSEEMARLALEDLLELPPDPGEGECAAALVLPDGARRPVRVRRLAVQGGQSIWVVCDVHTEGAEASEALARAEDALHESQEERLALEERLRREVAEREDMVGLMSHELRTPVTVISGYSRLLLSEEVGPLNEAQKGFLEASARSCKRLSDLIGTLLEAAAQARGEVVLELREAPLAPTVQDVVGTIKPLLEQKRIRLEIELRPEAARACFDPTRLEQVLTNLLGNAIRYTPPLGIIRIATRAFAAGRERFVEVSVTDSGPGVAPVDRERIFEPYVRGGGRDEGDGLGLGLAICRRLVEAHGGAIAVRDAPGGGACFAFTLQAPAAADPGS
jgi:signal transduction histidine kinase